MSESMPDTEGLILRYLDRLATVHGLHSQLPAPQYGYESGRRYYRIFKKDGSSRSVVSFVESATGDLYQAASWKQVGRRIGNLADILNEPVLRYHVPQRRRRR